MTDQSDSDQGVGPAPDQGSEWAWAQRPEDLIEAMDAGLARASELIEGLSSEAVIDEPTAVMPADSEAVDAPVEPSPEVPTELFVDTSLPVPEAVADLPEAVPPESSVEMPTELFADAPSSLPQAMSFAPTTKPLEWPDELDLPSAMPHLPPEEALPEPMEAQPPEPAPVQPPAPVVAQPVESPVQPVQSPVQPAPVQPAQPVQSPAQPVEPVAQPAHSFPPADLASQNWPEVTQLLPRTTGGVPSLPPEVPVAEVPAVGPDFSSDIFRDGPQVWPQQTTAADDEERKLAAERAARREARMRALSAPAPEPAAPPEPVIVLKRTTDKFVGSFGLMVLRLVTAAVVGIRGFQLLANRAVSEQQFSVSLLPEPQIWVLVAGFGSLLVALALVLGLLTRAAGAGLMLIALGDLIFFQYGAGWSPFIEGMPGFLGEAQLLATAIGLVFLCVGGGGWSFDRSVRASRERGRVERPLDEDDE